MKSRGSKIWGKLTNAAYFEVMASGRLKDSAIEGSDGVRIEMEAFIGVQIREQLKDQARKYL